MGLMIENERKYGAGEVFYYKSKGKLYGGIFLFKQRNYYLIAVSEEIAGSAREIDHESVTDAPLYTAAWFSDVDLLPKRRIHTVGFVSVEGDYTDRAGLLADGSGSVYLKNCGQRATWRHEFRAFALRDATMKDVLNTKFIPKTRI